MGKHTIKEVLKITNKLYANRFTYKDRDVVKRITIKEVKEVSRHDKPGQPRVYTKYVIESKSYPQYPPYLTRSDSRGRSRTYQRTISHEYDVVFEMDRLSINTKEWVSRVGSGKKWVTDPPGNQIKTITARRRRILKRKADRMGTTQAEKRRAYSQLVKDHRRRAKYLDVGDYNSRVNGLNGDWIFRCDYAYYKAGHRFGRNYYGNVPARQMNPKNTVFFTKHQLNVIDQLMNRGILKDI